jgi:hypothetical protein
MAYTDYPYYGDGGVYHFTLRRVSDDASQAFVVDGKSMYPGSSPADTDQFYQDLIDDLNQMPNFVLVSAHRITDRQSELTPTP